MQETTYKTNKGEHIISLPILISNDQSKKEPEVRTEWGKEMRKLLGQN